jgi:hypothetical protein
MFEAAGERHNERGKWLDEAHSMGQVVRAQGETRIFIFAERCTSLDRLATYPIQSFMQDEPLTVIAIESSS